MLNTPLFSNPSSSAKSSASRPDCRNRSRWASRAKSALLAAMAVGALTAGQAQAIIVNVNGQDWDVTTFTGSYNANTGKFALPPAPGVMPWWGSLSLASQFAGTVGDDLGFPNFGVLSPFFAYDAFGSGTPSSQANSAVFTDQFIVSTAGTAGFWDGAVWAQATPVPGPLPALGAAAAFGFSRQLKKRIKTAKGVVSASTSR
jgi:hypothetical protein